MVGRKAKNLILLSRSGARTEIAHAFLSELRRSDVRVEAPACDVTNITMMREVLGGLIASMPTVKGCIQGSMVRRVSLIDASKFSHN